MMRKMGRNPMGYQASKTHGGKGNPVKKPGKFVRGGRRGRRR